MIINSKTGVLLTGKLTSDPETRDTSSNCVTKFNVLYGMDKTQPEGKQGQFMQVDVWGGEGKALTTALQKGDRVLVAGELRKREYEGKTYYSVAAEYVQPNFFVLDALYSAPGGGTNMDESQFADSSAALGFTEEDGELPFL